MNENIPILELVKTALAARSKAYAPYSGFLVGAAVLTADERIYSGANIENASYGATNCAERTAVFKAVSEGSQRLKAIAVAGGPQGAPINEYAYPCGICRQVLCEFCGDPSEFMVIVAKSEEDYRVFSLAELLPESFGSEQFVTLR
jgi:cytidine deaminase